MGIWGVSKSKIFPSPIISGFRDQLKDVKPPCLEVSDIQSLPSIQSVQNKSEQFLEACERRKQEIKKEKHNIQKSICLNYLIGPAFAVLIPMTISVAAEMQNNFEHRNHLRCKAKTEKVEYCNSFHSREELNSLHKNIWIISLLALGPASLLIPFVVGVKSRDNAREELREIDNLLEQNSGLTEEAQKTQGGCELLIEIYNREAKSQKYI